MRKSIDDQTNYLFNRSYKENLTEDQEDDLLDQVDNQISEYGWSETFSSWSRYLIHKCQTPESVINYANLFWWYGGQDHPIIDPYQFLGYFYYRINFDIETFDSNGILDSLATTILPKSGYRDADLMFDPEYVPEKDPKIIAAVQAYKAGQTS